MTTVESSERGAASLISREGEAPAEPGSAGASPSRFPLLAPLAALWIVIERGLVRAGDWLNPILVKETRQALKSWQFTLTFVLLLVACWIVTIGGVALIGPSIYYAASGGGMLMAYYLILAFPLLVIVPFSAFRSLAAEREDNTYDLLSITSLRPRQIISGKLGSSVVQMAVYFSAITPCLAFTYLLRGVDVPTIVLLLVYTFLASLGLSMVGLLLATLSRQRYGQVILSVALIAMLLGAFWVAAAIAVMVVQESSAMLGSDEFLIGHLALATAYVTAFAMTLLAATAMITFATENRSTPLRIVMLLQHAAWIGWLAYFWIIANYQMEALLVMAMIAGGYWYAMGTMLTGEQREMSRRVMRRLPQSFLGRAFFTWLNPGPGSGYMFAVANLSSIVVVSLLAIGVLEWSGAAGAGRRWPGTPTLIFFLIIGWGYVVAYLGLGRLVIALLRRVTTVTMFAGMLVHILLLLAGSGIPTTIQLMSVELRNEPFTYLQVPNPFWCLVYVADSGVTSEAVVLLIIVPAAAICLLLLNLPGVTRELRKVRVALPKRVAEDEAELHPEPASLPTNPWDEEEKR